MDLEPTALVLLECRRRDDLPTLRRARIVACADGLVGLVLERERLHDLLIGPGTPIGLSAPGRFGVCPATVTAVEPDRRALVAEVDAVVLALRDRRRHRRTALHGDASWPTGAAAVVDVSPGGLLVVGIGPSGPTPVHLTVGDLEVSALAHPLGHADGRSRLRFEAPLPQLDRTTLVQTATFAA
ncbi:MAG: hypothetical protein AAFZ07_04355 [Actinomycetota bacterium]